MRFRPFIYSDLRQFTQSVLAISLIDASLSVRYDAARPRVERISLRVESDIQAVFSDDEAAHPDNETITLNGQDIGAPVTAFDWLTGEPMSPETIAGYVPGRFDLGSVQFLKGSGAPVSSYGAAGNYYLDTTANILYGPKASDTSEWGAGVGNVIYKGESIVAGPYYIAIGDVGRRSYFPIERGQWSIENLIARARARLLIRSRAAEVSFECSFERAINLSCRKNAIIYDSRLPGGNALGKIVRYRISADGTTGTMIGGVTIGCAVGRGNVLAPSPGTPIYVDDGYVDVGYQHYELMVIPLASNDIGYSLPLDAPLDDNLTFPLRKSDVVVKSEMHGNFDLQWNGAREQLQAATGIAGELFV